MKYFIAQQKGGVLLVIDDAEKLMANKFGDNSERNYTDKAFLNELVANPKVTIVFTCNGLPFDRSVLRRANLIVTFPETDEGFQQRLLGRIAVKHGLKLTEDEITKLTVKYRPVQPALLEIAASNAALTGDSGTFDVTLKSLTRYVNGTSRPRQNIPAASFGYDPNFLNLRTNGLSGDVALHLSKMEQPFSCLVYGEEGNGQDSFIESLIERLGRQPIYSLSGRLVLNDIEPLFQRCYDEKKILVLDDAASGKLGSPLEGLAFIQELTRHVRRRDVNVILTTSGNAATFYANNFEHVLGFLPPESNQRTALSQKLFDNVPLPEVPDASLLDYETVIQGFATAARESTDGGSTSKLQDQIRKSVDARVQQRKTLQVSNRRLGF